MLNIIIAIAVIAMIALLIMRNQQSKQENKNTKVSKAQHKSTYAKQESNTSETIAPAKPKVDIHNVIAQLDVLVADKQYAKAEGIINLSLNKDGSLHELYSHLLHLYHLQDDDFAVKQLLESVQNSNLNQIYQELYNEHEAYKSKRLAEEKLNAANKAPEIIEFVSQSSTHGTSVDFDRLAEESHDQPAASITFDSLEFESSSPAIAAKEIGITLESEFPSDISFSDVVEKVEPLAENGLSLDQNVTLDFKFNEKTDSATDTSDSALSFSLEQPVFEEKTTGLDFNLSAPAQENITQELSFDLTATPEAPITQVETEHSFTDVDDPIAQAFPALQNINPIDLDLDLAEKYVALGVLDTAKNLIAQHQNYLDANQTLKATAILQKIAS